MSPYLHHLHADLSAAILARWRLSPPHYFEMGIPERWLEPPAGYDGPPFGFGQEEAEAEKDSYLATLSFEKTLAEVEDYVAARPKITMFDHFGFEPEHFPPAERLTDEQIEALTEGICRLWAAYNFTPVFPQQAPARVVYPLLLARMGEPALVAKRGHIGLEFCQYEPDQCPFGTDYCDCKSF